MKWRMIRLPECDQGVSDSTRQKYAELEREIAAIVRKRGEIDSRSATLQASPVSPAVLIAMDGLKMDRVTVLQDELNVRDKILQFGTAYYDEVRDVHNRANEAKQQAEATVAEQLVAMGYAPAERIELQNRMEPGWLARHPSVIAAEIRLRNVWALFDNLNELQRMNNEGTIAAKQEMESYRHNLTHA